MEKIKMYKIVNKKLIYMNVDKTMIKEFRKNGFDVITIDNISLYYEFMSVEDLEKLDADIFDNLFQSRLDYICDLLQLIKSNYSYFYYFNKLRLKSFSSFNVSTAFIYANISLFVFGIKDTLKPIDEYIEEIKQSEAYKEYIAKKS